MITLTFTIDTITDVLTVFNRIEIRRYIGTDDTPTYPVTDAMADAQYTTVSGIDVVAGVSDTTYIELTSSYSQYYFRDPDGEDTNWYISRYYNITTNAVSAWSDPILGEPGDIYYNPLYPREIEYGTEDQMIIDRIRIYMGDPVGLNREYGEDAASSIHPDGKTYELDEKGWPASVNMNGQQYNSTADPSINGYRYLRFNDFIDITQTVVTGTCDNIRTITYGVDIWYYTFRHSDREIMEAYNTCTPPPSLTVTTANSEAYMLQTAIDLLTQELWEDSGEDGAVVTDEGSRYDPSPGLRARQELIDKLQKRLDTLVASLILTGITGVLLD